MALWFYKWCIGCWCQYCEFVCNKTKLKYLPISSSWWNDEMFNTFIIFQVRNHSSVSLMDVTEGLPTPVIERNTHMFTPVTNLTIVKWRDVTSPTLIPPLSENTWRCMARMLCVTMTVRTVKMRPVLPAPAWCQVTTVDTRGLMWTPGHSTTVHPRTTPCLLPPMSSLRVIITVLVASLDLAISIKP